MVVSKPQVLANDLVRVFGARVPMKLTRSDLPALRAVADYLEGSDGFDAWQTLADVVNKHDAITI